MIVDVACSEFLIAGNREAVNTSSAVRVINTSSGPDNRESQDGTGKTAGVAEELEM